MLTSSRLLSGWADVDAELIATALGGLSKDRRPAFILCQKIDNLALSELRPQS